MDQNLKINILVNDKSKQAFGNLENSLAKIRGSIFNLRNAFIGFGAGVVLKGFIDAGIQIENLGVQLTALFGSAKAGKTALEQVTKYAATTPFELRNIQQGITSLAVVRKTAEEAGISFEELLKITGNTATLLGNDFALASLQVQRSLSAGIASAELFRERGVTAMAGFTGGVTTSALDSAKGLRKTFGTGGEFGKLTQELSKTVGGTISNLKDAFFTFQVAVSQGFFGTLKKQLGDLQTFVEKNNEAIIQFGQSVGEKLAAGINALGSALVYVNDHFKIFASILVGIIALQFVLFIVELGKAFKALTVIVLGLNSALLLNPIVGGITATIAGITLLIAAYKSLKKEMSEKLPAPLGFPDETGFFETQRIKDQQQFGSLGGFFPNRNPELRQFRGSGKPQFGFEGSPELMGRGRSEQKLSLFEKTKKTLDELNNKELTTFEEKIKNIHITIAEGLNKGIKDFSVIFAESVILGKSLADSFKNMAQALGVQILSALIEVLARKSVELAIEKLITREKEKQRNLSAASGNPLAILSFLGLGRATGGAVSKGKPYMVGEQGPEMFIPNSTGQISQSARGTGGGAVSVNFNINTLDARGFDELLVRNRGTITQIINSAVNERGGKNLI